jgi:hypothetical protein
MDMQPYSGLAGSARLVADARAQQWTTTKPTEPGWYWVDGPGIARAYPNGLCLELRTENGDLEVDMPIDAEWIGFVTHYQGPIRPSGPLPVPEPPTPIQDFAGKVDRLHREHGKPRHVRVKPEAPEG